MLRFLEKLGLKDTLQTLVLSWVVKATGELAMVLCCCRVLFIENCRFQKIGTLFVLFMVKCSNLSQIREKLTPPYLDGIGGQKKPI